MALIFLPAADIPLFVSEGNCDLGITGLDQIQEAQAQSKVDDLVDLKFGACKLQVQVPENGDLHTTEQLVGRKIVSSFTRLSGDYFRKLEKAHGKQEGSTPIRYVGGSVEASCALGVADAIVDLVESGETMKAAGLKAIDTLLETSAHLISSKTPKFPELVEKIHQRVEGVLAAQKYVQCTYNAPKSILDTVLEVTPGRRAPTVSSLKRNPGESEDWFAISVMVEQKFIGDIMDELKKAGATDVMVFEISNCRV